MNAPNANLAKPQGTFQAPSEFFKEVLGFVTALGGLPILTAYFGVLPAPALSDLPSQAVVGMAAILNSGMFLVLYWNRSKIVSLRAGLLAWGALVLGVAIVAMSKISVGGVKLVEPPMDAMWYLGGSVVATMGGASILLQGFVRERERRKTLMDYCAGLDSEQWNSVNQFADLLVQVRDPENTKLLTGDARAVVQDTAAKSIRDILERAEKVVQGHLTGTMPEIRQTALHLASLKTGRNGIFTDRSPSCWDSQTVDYLRQVAGMGGLDVCWYQTVSVKGGEQDVRVVSLLAEAAAQRGGTVAMYITNSTRRYGAPEGSYFTIGNVAVLRWDPEGDRDADLSVEPKLVSAKRAEFLDAVGGANAIDLSQGPAALLEWQSLASEPRATV